MRQAWCTSAQAIQVLSTQVQPVTARSVFRQPHAGRQPLGQCPAEPASVEVVGVLGDHFGPELGPPLQAQRQCHAVVFAHFMLD